MMASQTYYATPTPQPMMPYQNFYDRPMPQQQQPQLVAPNRACAKDLKPEAFTKPYLEFMTENPTVFHAVGYFKEKLEKAGYKEVSCHSSPALPVDVPAEAQEP